MNWMFRLKIMPLLIIVAALSFGVRFGDFMSGVSETPGVAQAKSAVAADAEQTEEDISDEIGAIDVAQSTELPKANEDEPRTVPMPGADGKGEKVEWKDATDSDLEYSEVKMELFEDLVSRRKNLEVRERELAVREALLKAAEQEIDQKYKELISLRSEIQDLLKEQTEEEKARVASLVKIYEGMKPKDAARIFNTLDLDVLLQVVSEMSERKSAPIIASMQAERARTLTMMLMEQKSLPTVSDGYVP